MTRSPLPRAGSLLACGVAATVASAPTLAAEPAIEAGRTLYETLCARCHGADLRGSGHPALDITWFPEDQPERFATAVKRGKGFMPPVGRKLEADEIGAIWQFVQSTR